MANFNPIVIGAVLRVETVEACNSDWERHIHLRAWQGTQFEMDIDESLDVETRFRVGDYWFTVGVPHFDTGFGLMEIPEAQNAELRRKDAAVRAVQARHEAEVMREEAEEVMDELHASPPEQTWGEGAFATHAPVRQLFAPGIICTFKDPEHPFHPLKLMERQNEYWVVQCLDHGHVGLVLEVDLRHATPEETANLARKGGEV